MRPILNLCLWQRRYWEHTLRDDDDFARHLDYIHFNPVRHGHVTRVGGLAVFVVPSLVRLGVYPPDWAGDPAGDSTLFGEG